MRSGTVTFAQAGAILASLGLSVHRMSPPPEAFQLRGWMDTAFRLSGDIVPKRVDKRFATASFWSGMLELTAPGVFEVVALMPVTDGRPQYRVKGRDERYERIVTEDDMSLDVNNRFRRPLFGH